MRCFFNVRELAENFTQTKKSKKCVDFHARDEIEELLRWSIHAREEIEEMFRWRVGVPIFCQLSALAVRDASLMSLYIVEIFTNSILHRSAPSKFPFFFQYYLVILILARYL